jgi:hypothetical protein
MVWYLDLQQHMQSVPNTTKVVSSNPAQDEVYSIQRYVIKFVSDLHQIGGFHFIFTIFVYFWFNAPVVWPEYINFTFLVCAGHASVITFIRYAYRQNKT